MKLQPYKFTRSQLVLSAQHQRGAALAVSLMLLLIITIIGIASVSTTIQQERMSGNFFDRGLAFQSAETGIRVLEQALPGAAANAPPQIFTAANYPADLAAAQYSDSACHVAPCSAVGYCAKPDPQCLDRVLDPAFAGWANVTAAMGLPNLGALANNPQFISENMGESPSPPRWLGCEDVIPMDATCIIPVQHYRVSTRSTAVGRATVILQTDFANAL